MYILLKYDYSNDERIILCYKVSNNLDELKTPSPTNDIVTIWPGDYIHQYCYAECQRHYIVFIDYNRVDEVKNKFYNESIKLAKQCIREYNLIKILEK